MNNTSIIARISACNARVAAMNAGNEYAAYKGRPPLFNQSGFQIEANKLEELATLADEKAREFVVEDVDFDALVKPAKCTVNDSINYECQRDHGHSGPCAMRPLDVQDIQQRSMDEVVPNFACCDKHSIAGRCVKIFGHRGMCAFQR